MSPCSYVLGNHDLRYGTSPPQGCRCIDRRIATHRGLRILGLSGSRWYNGNVNQFAETEMAAFIRRLRLSLWWSRGSTWWSPTPRPAMSTMPKTAAIEGSPVSTP